MFPFPDGTKHTLPSPLRVSYRMFHCFFYLFSICVFILRFSSVSFFRRLRFMCYYYSFFFVLYFLVSLLWDFLFTFLRLNDCLFSFIVYTIFSFSSLSIISFSFSISLSLSLCFRHLSHLSPSSIFLDKYDTLSSFPSFPPLLPSLQYSNSRLTYLSPFLLSSFLLPYYLLPFSSLFQLQSYTTSLSSFPPLILFHYILSLSPFLHSLSFHLSFLHPPPISPSSNSFLTPSIYLSFSLPLSSSSSSLLQFSSLPEVIPSACLLSQHVARKSE